MNGLSSLNGLSAMNGLMTSSGGRKTVSYLIKCALAANDSLVKQDQNGVSYTFAGGIGLCPDWKNNDVHANGTCMEAISACMLAHVNTAGVHVPLWLDSNDTAIGWGVDRTNYPMQEGTFFGDIIDTGSLSAISKPGVTAPVAYYCDGAGFASGASGVVAGRLGANQSGSPYSNPFGTGTLCQNVGSSVGQFSSGVTGSCPANSNTNPSAGCPDGYKALTTNNGGVWQHGITVWRNNSYSPIFDTSYQYQLSAVLTNGNPMVLDTGASPLQQWNMSANLTTSVFNMAASGSGWTLSPTNNSSQCVDAGNGTNGTGLVLASCNGGSSQQFNITANASNGSFYVAAASTGRCMNVRSGSTSAGATMEVWDCSGWSSQQFNIQAANTVGAGNTSTGSGGSGGSSGTGGSGGSAPTFSSSRTYRMVPQNATGESIDVCNGGQTTGTCVQQYATQSVNSNQAFYLLQNGSNWEITMGANQAKCLGPNNNGTGNGTTMVVQDCNWSSAQSFQAMPMTTSGVYAFKNVASNRCLNVAGPTTNNGAALQLYDCGTTPGTNAQFSVQ
jgi:hypothetical protein